MCDAIRAAGRVADAQPEVAERILAGLMSLIWRMSPTMLFTRGSPSNGARSRARTSQPSSNKRRTRCLPT